MKETIFDMAVSYPLAKGIAKVTPLVDQQQNHTLKVLSAIYRMQVSLTKSLAY